MIQELYGQVVPKDVDTIIGLANALRAVDTAQEGHKVTSKLSTAERRCSGG